MDPSRTTCLLVDTEDVCSILCDDIAGTALFECRIETRSLDPDKTSGTLCIPNCQGLASGVFLQPPLSVVPDD